MEKLNLSSSPHIRGKKTVSGIMLDVIVALIPAAAASVIIFGYTERIFLSEENQKQNTCKRPFRLRDGTFACP